MPDPLYPLTLCSCCYKNMILAITTGVAKYLGGKPLSLIYK